MKLVAVFEFLAVKNKIKKYEIYYWYFASSMVYYIHRRI